jgi:hypothetical protein
LLLGSLTQRGNAVPGALPGPHVKCAGGIRLPGPVRPEVHARAVAASLRAWRGSARTRRPLPRVRPGPTWRARHGSDSEVGRSMGASPPRPPSLSGSRPKAGLLAQPGRGIWHLRSPSARMPGWPRKRAMAREAPSSLQPPSCIASPMCRLWSLHPRCMESISSSPVGHCKQGDAIRREQEKKVSKDRPDEDCEISTMDNSHRA